MSIVLRDIDVRLSVSRESCLLILGALRQTQRAGGTHEKGANLVTYLFCASHSLASWQLGILLVGILSATNEAHRDSRHPSYNFRLVGKRILLGVART